MENSFIFRRKRSELDRQARPVSQIQIRQCEHHVQFCSLLSQTSVSCLSVPEDTFYHAEYVFHFGPNRRFCVFFFLSCVVAAFAELLNLGRSSVDLVLNLFAVFVAYYSILAIRCAKITAVTIHCFLFTGEQLRCLCDIVYIRPCYFERMYQPGIFINTNVRFIAKMLRISLFNLMGIRIPLLLHVFCRRRSLDNR